MNLRKMLSAAFAVLVFLLIATSVAKVDAWNEEGAGDAEDMDALVGALFTDHVIALEVLGILLTAAMIGALALARPIGSLADHEHYPHHGQTGPEIMVHHDAEEEE